MLPRQEQGPATAKGDPSFKKLTQERILGWSLRYFVSLRSWGLSSVPTLVKSDKHQTL